MVDSKLSSPSTTNCWTINFSHPLLLTVAKLTSLTIYYQHLESKFLSLSTSNSWKVNFTHPPLPNVVKYISFNLYYQQWDNKLPSPSTTNSCTLHFSHPVLPKVGSKRPSTSTTNSMIYISRLLLPKFGQQTSLTVYYKQWEIKFLEASTMKSWKDKLPPTSTTNSGTVNVPHSQLPKVGQ